MSERLEQFIGRKRQQAVRYRELAERMPYMGDHYFAMASRCEILARDAATDPERSPKVNDVSLGERMDGARD